MRKSRLSQHKQNKLIELFVAGVAARTDSKLVNVNKKYSRLLLSSIMLTHLSNKPTFGNV